MPTAGLRAVAWETVMLVGGLIPLSTAIRQSGAGDEIAQLVLDVVGTGRPYVLLMAAMFVLTTVLGLVLSNTATVLIVLPIAVACRRGSGIVGAAHAHAPRDRRAPALITPSQTPANLMIMAPGGYRFGDYWKLGLPLMASGSPSRSSSFRSCGACDHETSNSIHRYRRKRHDVVKTRMRIRAAGVTSALILTGTLAACGGDDSSGATPEPSESTSASASESASETASESASPSISPAVLANTYVSTEVTGYDLVADTTIRLTFEDGNLSVNAGCNTMFAPYELTDDSLAWTEEPAATMMGCPDDLAAQDQWLAELFTTGVGAAADGPTLTLTSDDVTIVLSRAPEADLQELFGKTWSAVATMADGATSRIPRVVRTPRVVVARTGAGRRHRPC